MMLQHAITLAILETLHCHSKKTSLDDTVSFKGCIRLQMSFVVVFGWLRNETSFKLHRLKEICRTFYHRALAGEQKASYNQGYCQYQTKSMICHTLIIKRSDDSIKSIDSHNGRMRKHERLWRCTGSH